MGYNVQAVIGLEIDASSEQEAEEKAEKFLHRITEAAPTSVIEDSRVVDRPVWSIKEVKE